MPYYIYNKRKPGEGQESLDLGEVPEKIEPRQKIHRNRPDLAKYGEEYVQPGDNSRFLRYAMASLDLPPIDISDPQQVEDRIYEYFDYCIANDRKPSMVGMANWLGVGRDVLNDWKNGTFRRNTHTPIIQKAVGMLEELWVDYMQNGKANPASLIFLGKNLFGYKDVQDVVVTPKQPLGEELPIDELQKRISDGVVVEMPDDDDE